MQNNSYVFYYKATPCLIEKLVMNYMSTSDFYFLEILNRGSYGGKVVHISPSLLSEYFLVERVDEYLSVLISDF